MTSASLFRLRLKYRGKRIVFKNKPLAMKKPVRHPTIYVTPMLPDKGDPELAAMVRRVMARTQKLVEKTQNMIDTILINTQRIQPIESV